MLLYLLQPRDDAFAVKPVLAGEVNVNVVLVEVLQADRAVLVWNCVYKGRKKFTNEKLCLIKRNK